MKLARISIAGHVHTAMLTSDKKLLVDGVGSFSPEEVDWLPPVMPTKVIGLALNYADHAAELDMSIPEEPALFFKPVSALVGHLSPVVYPQGVRYMHYEVELVVVIGQRCRNVPEEQFSEVIAGYTIGNDVTVRDFVGNFYRPPVRAKGYDTFGPVGPFLVTPDEIPDPTNLNLRARVNGEIRQEGNTAQLIRPIPELIAFISTIMTLEPGDMIWTGTPRGVTPVYPGDRMQLEIDGLEVLENPVISAAGQEQNNNPVRNHPLQEREA